MSSVGHALRYAVITRLAVTVKVRGYEGGCWSVSLLASILSFRSQARQVIGMVSVNIRFTYDAGLQHGR